MTTNDAANDAINDPSHPNVADKFVDAQLHGETETLDTEATLIARRDETLRATKVAPPPPIDVNDSAVGDAATTRADVVDAADRRDWDGVRAYLAHDSWRVRTTALTMLARAHESTTNDVSLFALSEIVDERRVLAQVGIWDSNVDLVALLGDADVSVSEAAAWALGERCQTPSEDDPTHSLLEMVEPDQRVLDALHYAAIEHVDHMTREAAVAALGAIGHEQSLPIILQATTDKATVRRRAAIALVNYSGDQVDAALDRLRNDRDWQVRQAAEDLRPS